ncbi:MFS transporter [Microbacterium enclense]|uniref:MFS transporter n=1 Tax=Microbacterium enclense TaxID=993073 RepID=UPI003D715FDD
MSSRVDGARVRMPGVVRLMSTAAGLVGANVHYSQPLLPVIALSLGVAPELVSALPAATQLGFALGLLIVLPLADMLDRRRLVVLTIVVAGVALVGQALAPSVGWLLAAGFLVGMASVAPQVLSPFAAAVAPPGREGQAAGIVLSGILMGVLLSKIVAGTVAATAGWHVLYLAASAVMFILAIVLWRALPPSSPSRALRWGELVASPIRLLRAHPALRLHSLLGALVSAMFMAFWATYALHLQQTFGWGPFLAGLFGFAGIAGSLLAPLSGRAVDNGHVRGILLTAAAATLLSFLGLGLGGGIVAVILICVVVLDAAVGLTHAANQARIFRIDPDARGRLNSVYMFSYFAGGAAGTSLAAAAYGAFGWWGVCGVGLALSLAMTSVVLAKWKMLARPV